MFLLAVIWSIVYFETFNRWRNKVYSLLVQLKSSSIIQKELESNFNRKVCLCITATYVFIILSSYFTQISKMNYLLHFFYLLLVLL